MKINRFDTLTTRLNNYKAIRLFIQYLRKFFITIFITHLQIASLQWHFIVIISHVDIHTYAVTLVHRFKTFHSAFYFYSFNLQMTIKTNFINALLSYELVFKYPDTFWIISRKERRLIDSIDFVKLIYICCISVATSHILNIIYIHD